MSNQSTEDLLRDGMARFAADVTQAPGGLAARAIRQRRRRGFVRAAAAAGTLAAVIAVIAAIAAIEAAPARPAGQEAQTAAFVISRTESALGTVSSENFVESYRFTTLSGSGVIFENVGPVSAATTLTMWMYAHQVKLVTHAAGGQLGTVSGWSTTGQMITTTADYQNRTWWRRSGPGVSPYAKLSACRAAEEVTLQGPWETGYGDLAAQLRTALRCGQFWMAGRQRVDGVETVELKLIPSADTPVRQTFWVDASSYLPVRSVVANYSIPGKVWEYQTDYRWLPPTAANVAEVHVTIPAGFAQVAAPASP